MTFTRHAVLGFSEASMCRQSEELPVSAVGCERYYSAI